MSKKEERYLLVGLIVAVLGCVAAWLAVPQVQNLLNGAESTPSVMEVDVNASEDWKATGIIVEAGDRLTITYLSDKWSNCPDFGCPYVDANGVLERYINAPDSLLKECNHAALIGRIGSASYCVNNNFSEIISQSGTLFLRINDEVLEDNAGKIIVRIELEPKK